MELIFETIDIIGEGNYPDFVQFEKTEGEIFFLSNGLMYGTPSEKLDGDFSSPEWLKTHDINPAGDADITNLELKTISGFGVVGSYTTPTAQKLLIYEFQHDLSDYLNSGSIKHSMDDPMSSFTLSLENPDIKDPERPGNIAIGENSSLLSPGAKVVFNFGAGDDDTDYNMGTFYIDRSNFTLLSETVTADGRNTIGKVLKDQTVDEKNEYWYGLVSEHIKKLFENANIDNDYYLVENTSHAGWFNFSPNISYEKALSIMLEVLPQWKVRELSDGTIVVGSESYAGFNQPGIYTFYRNKDIFSRQITRDDAEAYNRVCVHTNNYAKVVYRDVASFQTWNLQANRTLYVQVAEGLKFIDLENYADELAIRLEGVGKLESFTGPFRPHLQLGDEAIIVDEKGSKSLGLITEITHNFGKAGFYTDFTVDSGGSVGKGRLSDFIGKIAVNAMQQKSNAGWDDIDMTEYRNLSKYADIVVSSTYKTWSYAGLMNDGLKYAEDDNLIGDEGWQPSKSDESPWIEFKFKQRCLVDKVKLWLSYDYATEAAEDPEHWSWDYLPEYYKIQYWNGAFWVDWLTVDWDMDDIDYEMTHEFDDAVETSAIRFILRQKVENNQNWREIELWGNM